MTVYVLSHYRMTIGIYDDRELAIAARDEWIKRYPGDTDTVSLSSKEMNQTWRPWTEKKR